MKISEFTYDVVCKIITSYKGEKNIAMKTAMAETQVTLQRQGKLPHRYRFWRLRSKPYSQRRPLPLVVTRAYSDDKSLILQCTCFSVPSLINIFASGCYQKFVACFRILKRQLVLQITSLL